MHNSVKFSRDRTDAHVGNKESLVDPVGFKKECKKRELGGRGGWLNNSCWDYCLIKSRHTHALPRGPPTEQTKRHCFAEPNNPTSEPARRPRGPDARHLIPQCQGPQISHQACRASRRSVCGSAWAFFLLPTRPCIYFMVHK